jgi:hypothetical protein
MKRLALIIFAALALATAPTAGAAIQAAMTSPAAGASGLTGIVPVNVTASADAGIYSVQLLVDGTPYGQPDLTPTSLYQYTIPWDTSTVAEGPHTLVVKATDWSQALGGASTTTTPITVNVGPAAPTIAITIPPSWTFVRGTVQIQATTTSTAAPTTVVFSVDGQQLTGTTWDTTKTADGSHTLTGTITDGRGRTATASATVTVDNTAPTAVLYAPPAGSRVFGSTTLQVHASDAFGVASVQFTVDGNPVGAVLTKPDGGSGYLYSATWDASSVAAGPHAISATVTDNAGNVTKLAGVTVTTLLGQFLPVLNYHEINPPNGYSIYDETPAEADAQLAYLKANGYQSVTLEQYQQWLAGANIGIAKPVLITVDDGLRSERAWDPLLAKYGFEAVMFVVTGFADNNTPGMSDPNNMNWSDIQGLARTGRWEIAFHAGKLGHGDSYGSGEKANGKAYGSACAYFYSCLGYDDLKRGRLQPFAEYQKAVTQEVQQGVAELKQKVPTASLAAIAMPFNDAGQWTNLYNDPSGQAQAWMPGFFASQFPIVFTQTNPITYQFASGTVGSLMGYNRHYRFEVHTDTTIPQFAATLTDPAFSR